MDPKSALLLSIPSPLFELQKQRTNELRCNIVRANYNTQFARAAPELAEFRRAITNLDGMDNDSLSDTFRERVHFTSYNSYAPFIAKLRERPCKLSAIVDLLAPGVPDYVAGSSSTSGGQPKFFPKYNRLSKIRSSDSGSQVVSDSLPQRTTASICNLNWDPMRIMSDDNSPVPKMYDTSGAVVDQRSWLSLDPEKDEERMGTFILDHTAPYAAGFIWKWRSFLLIHGLFAVSSRSLTTVFAFVINTFVDMMRHLDAEFDMIVDCIANGTIPDLEGMEEVRHYLESNILPDPERAAELRSFGRPSSRPNWCTFVWPNLRSIIAIASGPFASSIPVARSYLGPDTELRTLGFGSTEGWIGSPYDPLELNWFKLDSNNLLEFLDVNKDDLISELKQLWEVEAGKRYELVFTTQDGLWRYRLGDVLKIVGFDPTDGSPVMEFVERNGIAIRFLGTMVTESQLRGAMSSVPKDMLDNVVEWTVAVDSRCVSDTIGFFVELASDQVSDLASGARDHVQDELSRLNDNTRRSIENERLLKPTIRIVRQGTFSEFRQMKLDEGSKNLGQVKVPVVLPKDAYVAWFSDRVVKEL